MHVPDEVRDCGAFAYYKKDESYEAAGTVFFVCLEANEIKWRGHTPSLPDTY